MNKLMYLHDNLKYLRKKNGWTYKDLDSRTNISCSTLYRIENSLTLEPSVVSIILLADTFGVSIDDLIKKDISNFKLDRHGAANE